MTRALTAYELKLNRQELEEILETHQLLDQIRQCLDDVLLTAQARGLGKNQIEQVLLVGGSSQLPVVQDLLRSYFGKKKVRCERPFDAVALGALQVGRQVKLEDRPAPQLCPPTLGSLAEKLHLLPPSSNRAAPIPADGLSP
jgi:molecular chaperone DnaK (HSP70)